MLPTEIEDLISRALAEDIGLGDLTSDATVEPGSRARARIEQKRPGVICGLDVAEAVFRKLDPVVDWRSLRPEGEWLEKPPAIVAELVGDARALLRGERVALNFVQHLSGIATLTASCVRELRGTGVEVLDTRKTIPGMRLLEKRAVVAGGGRNHRMGLYDAMLVKSNHAALVGGVGEATRRAIARKPPDVDVEVECRTLEEVRAALEAGADHLLLDNMEPGELARAVELVAGRARLEASGGISRSSLEAVASTGVQFVSLGSLTHSAPALDLSMTIEPA